MHRADTDELGFLIHPNTETVDEHLDGELRGWVDAEGEEVDPRRVAIQLLPDASWLVETISERSELA